MKPTDVDREQADALWDALAETDGVELDGGLCDFALEVMAEALAQARAEGYAAGKADGANNHAFPGMEQSAGISDPCPSCGRRTLFVGEGGWLTCSSLSCQEPGLGRAIELVRAEGAREERRAICKEIIRACAGDAGKIHDELMALRAWVEAREEAT